MPDGGVLRFTQLRLPTRVAALGCGSVAVVRVAGDPSMFVRSCLLSTLVVASTGCFVDSLPSNASDSSQPSAVGPASLGAVCETDEDCDEGQRCAWEICVGGGGTAQPVDGVPEPWDAVRLGCNRLHSDCSEVCTSPFVECWSDATMCAEQFTADYIEDYDFPLFDDELAASCAAQVADQACGDLSPDTLECEYAVTEGCALDDDRFGAIYSPFRAAELPVGEPLVVMLCGWVPEFFRVELAQGQRIVITPTDEDAPTPNVSLQRMVADGQGYAHIEDVDGSVDLDADPSNAVPAAGEYLLSFEFFGETQLASVIVTIVS